MKLLFEHWRKYLKEIERTGPGHTKSRYEQTAGPIAFDGFAKTADAGGYGNPGDFLEEDNGDVVDLTSRRQNNEKEFVFNADELSALNNSIAKIVDTAKQVLGADGETP